MSPAGPQNSEVNGTHRQKARNTEESTICEIREVRQTASGTTRQTRRRGAQRYKDRRKPIKRRVSRTIGGKDERDRRHTTGAEEIPRGLHLHLICISRRRLMGNHATLRNNPILSAKCCLFHTILSQKNTENTSSHKTKASLKAIE